MAVNDLHILPKFRDGWSYLYVEHCKIDKEDQAIAFHDKNGKVPVPCANLALLMLGPGTSVTHSAITVLADHGCLVAWCGEEGVRFYASGTGETRNSLNFLHQARLWANPDMRMKVVRNMYQLRFGETLLPDLTLQQIRGMEGARVRDSYAKASKETGVPWSGRNYQRSNWNNADSVNKALSAANSCLYGICHAAIVSTGFSPTLGFIHTGKMLSFVYDVADLYKTEICTPIAFKATAEGSSDLERRVRIDLRETIKSSHLLERIIDDIETVLMIKSKSSVKEYGLFDYEIAKPGFLWDPVEGKVGSGRTYDYDRNNYMVDEDYAGHDS